MINVCIFRDASSDVVHKFNNFDDAEDHLDHFWIWEVKMSVKNAKKYFSNYVKKKGYGYFYIEQAV